MGIIAPPSAGSSSYVVTKTPEEYGCIPNNGISTGSDCSAGYEECLKVAKEAAEAKGMMEANILHQALTYWFTRNPIQKLEGTTKWYTQCAIPKQSPTNQKFRFNLLGTGPLGFDHWNQTQAQKQGGTILRSTYTGGTEVPLWGIGSILGGPTLYEESTAASFTNIHLHTDGITFMLEHNPGIFIGLDMRMIAQWSFGDVAAMVPRNPAEMEGGGLPSTESFAFFPPISGNNAIVEGDSITVEGWFWPIVLTEHMRINTIGAVYVGWGMQVGCWQANPGGFPQLINTGNQHSCIILQATVEQTTHGVIKVLGNGAETSTIPVYMTVDCEAIGTAAEVIVDSENALRGIINVRTPVAVPVNVIGCKKVQINITEGSTKWVASGPIGPPGVPATGVNLLNPYRTHAMIYITGGTVTSISIDGVEVGAISGWFPIRSNGEIKITYSVVPTWKWWLI